MPDATVLAAHVEPALVHHGGAAADAALTPAQAALLATLESVAKEPISAEELERARVKWLNGWEQQFTDPQKIGVALSESVAQGDWRLFFLLRDRAGDIT